MFTAGDFEGGMRVELHPGTDRWMMGDRFGTVVHHTLTRVHVKMDVSGKTLRCVPQLLLPLMGLTHIKSEE